MIYDENIDLDEIRIAQDPVFIIGCPRSGTTLLQSLLATQKGVCSFRETHFFSILMDDIAYDRHNCISKSSIPVFIANLNRLMSLDIASSVRTKLEILAESGKLDVKRLFETVIYPFIKNQTNNRHEIRRIRWIEKTPSHFRSLKLIQSFYPDVRFVCIVRHPVPVVLSRKSNIPADQRNSIEFLAHQWNEMIFCIESFEQKHPNRIYTIRYEDLVEDLIHTMTSVTQYLNMPFDFNLLDKFSDVGSRFVLPHEKWKRRITTSKIKNTNSNWTRKAGILNTCIIQMLTRKNMRKYKYKPFNKYLQKWLDLGVHSLLRVRA